MYTVYSFARVKMKENRVFSSRLAPVTLPDFIFFKSFGLKSFYNYPEQACKLNLVNACDYIFLPNISSGLHFELLIFAAFYLVWMLLILGFILNPFMTYIKVKPGVCRMF